MKIVPDVAEETESNEEETISDEETLVGEEKAMDVGLTKQSPIVIQVQEVPIGC